MAAAEIEYPLSGAKLGPNFKAGGTYDLTLPYREPTTGDLGYRPPALTTAAPVVICKLMENGAVIATSAPSGTLTDGTWTVAFTNVTGTHPSCDICSYIKVGGTEYAMECMGTVSITPGYGLTLAVAAEM